MTREEQIKFVRDLAQNISEGIVARIELGDIPPEWDGHELRFLLARHFTGATFSMTKKKMMAFMREVRTRDL